MRLEEQFRIAAEFVLGGKIDLLTNLLEQRPCLASYLEKPDLDGVQNTLLHYLAISNCKLVNHITAIFHLLLKHGANIHQTNQPKAGETPLHTAIAFQNWPYCKLLLKAGAQLEDQGRFRQTIDTALGYFLFYRNQEKEADKILNLLLRLGAKMQLPHAAALGNLSRVKLLSPIKQENFPAEPLQQAFLFACMNGHKEIAAYLLNQGAIINLSIPFFSYEATALHLACRDGQQKELVEYLIKRGGNPKLEDSTTGSSAIGWAMHYGQDQVFEVLMRA